MVKETKILFYDIETSPLRAWVWRLGKQAVRHHQLDEKYSRYGIICLAYKWAHQKRTKIIHWGYDKQNTKRVIKKFDKIASKADIVIGKNSDRFDIKHLNSQRMIAGLPGLPNYMNNMDDLEKQFRKYFTFPSFSLDYLAKELLGTDGKMDMELQDWINIVEKKNKKSFYKMIKYCKLDVIYTEKLWNYAKKHFKPRYNMATIHEEHTCRLCGSTNIRKNGTRPRGKTMYQMFFCNDHGGYAGQAPISKKTKKIGRIG